jgi:hypothetical protein
VETHPAWSTTLELLLLLLLSILGGALGGRWFGCDPAQPAWQRPSPPLQGVEAAPAPPPTTPPQLCGPEPGSPSTSRPGGWCPIRSSRWSRGSPVCWASPDLLPSLPDP